jgi:hypothetical protein
MRPPPSVTISSASAMAGRLRRVQSAPLPVQDMAPLPVQDMAPQILELQPLHNQDDDVRRLVVEPGEKGGLVPLPHELALGLGIGARLAQRQDVCQQPAGGLNHLAI